MNKHDCHIDVLKRQGGEDWGYFSHSIVANNEAGFITHATWRGPSEPSEILGFFYESKAKGPGKPAYWWWTLKSFTPNGRERQSNKHFSDKGAAIASLKKALSRKGYRLTTYYTWQTEGNLQEIVPDTTLT